MILILSILKTKALPIIMRSVEGMNLYENIEYDFKYSPENAHKKIYVWKCILALLQFESTWLIVLLGWTRDSCDYCDQTCFVYVELPNTI